MAAPNPPFTSASDEPIYTIGVVSRMTGISIANLRAWERRYQFPETDRTRGGHRLYSERDVLRLQWVQNHIDAGLHTAQAIQALRLEESRPSHQVSNLLFDETFEVPENAELLERYARTLLEALLDKQLDTANQALSEALAAATPDQLILYVIGPALSGLGAAWEQGRIDVVTEHLASNFLRQRLMLWLLSGPPPQKTTPIVLACAPGELHEGSLLMLGALLRRRRWPIAYLGQAVPLEDLAGFVCEIRPPVVVTVAMTLETAQALSHWPEFLQNCPDQEKPLFTFGGRAFVKHPELLDDFAGTYLGDSIQEGLETIERLSLAAR